MQEEKYRVYSVSTPPESVTESRGSRPKFWISVEGEKRSWLLKFPRQETGEHWAEKIAAEIGNLIGVNCARVELARCEGQSAMFEQARNFNPSLWSQYLGSLGTICQSFVPEEQDILNLGISNLADAEIHFIHGSGILQFTIDEYDTDPRLRFHQKDHNIKNIVKTIMQITDVGSLNPMPLWDEMLKKLASYTLLDGIIGNTDRHHENWMIELQSDHSHPLGIVNSQMYAAPSYDHASSLGRELSDEKRQLILDSNRLLNYLQGSKVRGGIFVDSNRKRPLSPLRLAKLLCRWQPRFTRPALDIIKSVPNSDFRAVIDKMPSEFMSDIAKEFAYQVVITSKAELIRSIQ